MPVCMSDMTATLLSMFKKALNWQNGHGDLAEKLIHLPGISLNKGTKMGVTPSSAAAKVTRKV